MNQEKVLITGGVGFLGQHLVNHLLKTNKYKITIFDRLKDIEYPKGTVYFNGDISSDLDVAAVFKKHGPFTAVYHLASAMPNKAVSDQVLWETNVNGTYNLAKHAAKNKVKSFMFTSSNVTYGIPKILPVTEETQPDPLEIYGKSKIEAENKLRKFAKDMSIQIIRCPVISGLGRLGLQAILFEFISENKNVYLLGDGANKYQFVDADDVAIALEKASHKKSYGLYNIGADKVVTLKEIYQAVIKYAKSSSKIIPLPAAPAQIILSILDKLNISPLGPYQYSMLGRSIYFDTTKIKRELKWNPQKTNTDTFIDNYKWYMENKGKFVGIESEKASSNRSLPKMGIFKLLKIIS